MNRISNLFSRQLFLILIPFTMLVGLMFFMKSSAFKINSDSLALPITIDLLLIIPIVYFLIIRKTDIPKTTIIPVMVIGLIIGSYFMPENDQTYLELFKIWVLPIVEISILTFVIFKVRKGVKKYKNVKNANPDFFSTLKEVSHEILPKKIVIPFATEIAVIYYAFINWKSRPLNIHEYTHHKNSGTQALLLVFIFIIGIETFVIHLLLNEWSQLAAWILTGLSIYTAIQVLGFAKSLSKRPFVIKQNHLILRYGLLSETEIELRNIERIELTTKSIEDDESIKTLSPLGAMEGHNMILYLKEKSTLEGLYGFKKEYTKIAFSVDEKDTFKNEIENQIAKL